MITVPIITILSIIIVFFIQLYVSANNFDNKLKKMYDAYKEKRFDLVSQYLDQFEIKQRQDPKVLWVAANMYSEQQQYILAMLQLQGIIDGGVFTTDITEVKVYKMLAKMFEETGNTKKALETSEVAAKLSFDDFDTMMETATLAYKNGSYAVSNQYLLKALELNSQNPTLYYLLADIAFKGKGYKMAKEYISKAVELDGEQLIYSLLSGKISYSEKNYADAVQYFSIVFEKSDELKKDTSILLGNSYYSMKDYENTKKYYSYLLDNEDYIRDESLIDERYHYAQIFVGEKSYEKALEQWKIIKTLRNIYLDIDEKIKTYTTIINNHSFRTALKTDIVEYLEKHLYNVLTLNGYIVTSHMKKTETLIYFTAMKKFSEEGQSYLCAFALDTSGNKIRKDTIENFENYINEKQTVHAFVLSIGGFAASSIYENIEFIEPERFDAILEGVISFSN